MNEKITSEERASLLGLDQSDRDIVNALPTEPTDDEAARIAIIRNEFLHVCRRFAADLTRRFSDRAKVKFSVDNVKVTDSKFSEFVFGLDYPTCLQLLEIEGFASPWLIDLQPHLLFPLIDRLLGGGKLPARIVRRPLTDLEARLAGRLALDIVDALANVWAAVSFQGKVLRTEFNPKLARDIRPGTAMTVCRFDIEFEGERSTLRMAMVADELSGFHTRLRQEASSRAPSTDSARGNLLSKALLDRSIATGTADAGRDGSKSSDVLISLAEVTVECEQMEQLKVGDVIRTGVAVDAPATVFIDGQPRYYGRAGYSRGKKAVKIVSAIVSANESAADPVTDLAKSTE